MSFWDNVKKFTQPYGEDDYDEYDDEEEVADDYEEPVERERPAHRIARRAPATAPVEEPAEDDGFELNTASILTPASSSSAPSGFSGQVLNLNTASSSVSASNKQSVVLFRPNSFNDTSKAADDLRARKAVIVNMENVDKAMARRVVDFLSGCVYALDGDVKKIAQSAYIFCPHNMDIVGDLETLQAEVESYI